MAQEAGFEVAKPLGKEQAEAKPPWVQRSPVSKVCLVVKQPQNLSRSGAVDGRRSTIVTRAIVILGGRLNQGLLLVFEILFKIFSPTSLSMDVSSKLEASSELPSSITSEDPVGTICELVTSIVPGIAEFTRKKQKKSNNKSKQATTTTTNQQPNKITQEEKQENFPDLKAPTKKVPTTPS